MFKKWNNSPLFEEMYCLILCIVTLLCWCFSSLIGMIFILCIAIISLILLKDFKYMIPCGLFFLFSNNNEYETAQFPVAIFICGILFLIVLIGYIIKNGFHISKAKSAKGIFLLSISCLLPIFWYNIIPNGKETLYLLYLTYFFYFLIYIIFASSLKKDSFRMIIKTMSYIGILLAFECLIGLVRAHQLNPEESILSHLYYLGWGLCNEAGIMMCVCIPFVFIELIKTDKFYKVLLCLLKIGIIAIGMVLTTSRGTLLFGAIEILLLAIWSVIFSKKKNYVIGSFVFLLVFFIIVLQQTIGLDVLFLEIKENIFFNDFSSNGRLELWKSALQFWSKDFVRMTFGSGMIVEFSIYDLNRYVVYHSTLFQCLATMGNLGFAFLIIHFIEKYKQLKKFDKSIFGIMLIGYVVVDLYGMIDNTYGMYYYMVPLMLIMASLDNCSKDDILRIY